MSTIKKVNNSALGCYCYEELWMDDYQLPPIILAFLVCLNPDLTSEEGLIHCIGIILSLHSLF